MLHSEFRPCSFPGYVTIQVLEVAVQGSTGLAFFDL